MFHIHLYRSAAGASPVREFLDGLPEKHAAKVMEAVDRLAQAGPALQRPQVAHVRGKLWELRVSWARLEYRVIYCFMTGGNCILVHGFVKKKQEIPAREIRVAEDRQKDYEERVRKGEVIL